MTKPPPLPREHGAWVMLALPLLLGLALAGPRSIAAWLVPVASVLAFLAHYALVPVLQRAREGKPAPEDWKRRRITWGSIYLGAAGASFAAAVVLAPDGTRPALLLVAAAAALLAVAYAAASALGSGRTIWSEVVGMSGLALSAPMMAAASGVPPGRGVFAPAAVCLGYFLSSLSFVRCYERLKVARRAATTACVAVHVGLAAGLVAASVAAVLPRGWWIAFVPVVARTAWGLARPPASLRALGLREIWVALTFALFAALALVG